MDVFRDLYQQLIIDHNQNPRNFCKLENASHSADGYNPLCGDEITVSFIEKDSIIEILHLWARDVLFLKHLLLL